MSKKINFQDFIDRSKERHGDKYDYTKVEYINTLKSIDIICKEHGIFNQIPKIHMKGHGCQKCAGNNKLNTNLFIEKCLKKHGDKYDYTKVEYVNSNTKIDIICKKHGIFNQTPNSHLNGHGCPQCFSTVPYTTESIIMVFKKIHNDKYDYSFVCYKNYKTDIIINCKEHGIFKQKPYHHIIGKGCPVCGKKHRNNKKYDNKKFIDLCSKNHDNKYLYNKTIYIDMFNYITITCPIHGDFKQKAYSHLYNKSGCKKCANHNVSIFRNSNTEDFISKAQKVHGIKYDYTLVNYDKAIKKISIICKKHGIFNQTPNSHLNGNGCSSCYQSKGEHKIEKYLIENNIKFKKQHKFNDCKNITFLKFDFYLYEKNICIEFDGEQHFKQVSYYKKNELLLIQKRDNLKNEYCYKNNIKLIRIKYTDFKNITFILNEQLNLIYT